MTDPPIVTLNSLVVGSLWCPSTTTPGQTITKAFAKLTSIHAKHGPFDVILSCGDVFEPPRFPETAEADLGDDTTPSDRKEDTESSQTKETRSIDNMADQDHSRTQHSSKAPVQSLSAEMTALISGKISIPAPTYIISGKNTVPWQAFASQDGFICPNLTLLGGARVFDAILVCTMTPDLILHPLDHTGRQGILTTAEGLRIAFISGIFNQQKYFRKSPPQTSASRFYTKDEVDTLIASTSSKGVDILLSYEWPASIMEKSNSPIPTSLTSRQWLSSKIDLVLGKVQPRYHFAGGPGVFWAREPFMNMADASAPSTHPCRFIGLGEFGSASKERWFYAFQITPMSKMNMKELAVRPENVTENPLRVKNGARVGVGMGEGESGCYFFRQPGERKGPPSTYVCRACNVPGHWIEECPDRLARPKKKPRTEFVDPTASRDAAQCWFCLSNPALEKHLIIHIGNELYVTLAKGGLVEDHIIIIPIGHFPSTASLLSSAESAEGPNLVLEELDIIKTSIRRIFHADNKVTISFELYAGTNSDEEVDALHHMHHQFLAFPADQMPLVEDTFMQFARAQGLHLWERLPGESSPLLPSGAYCKVELDTQDASKVLIFVPTAETLAENDRLLQEYAARGHGRRAPKSIHAHFGRMVLAQVLGKPDRANWKRCVESEEVEMGWTERLKKRLALE